MRIVSLLPSATEIVYALGLEDSLAGVSYECDYPPEARSKPVVDHTALPLDQRLSPAEIDRLVGEMVARGDPLYVVDDEAVARIQPDLILAQDLCRVCAVPSGQVEDALAALGCQADVLSLDPNTLDDVLDGIVQVGERTGTRERAEEVVAGLRTRVTAVAERARALPRRRVLALEWSEPPFVGGHWIPEMVELAGGEPVLGEVGVPSVPLTWDVVGARDYDLVVFMPCGYGLDAAVEEAVTLPDLGCPVYATDSSAFFSRPGPRLVDGLEILAWAIHPDAFPEPPPRTVARVKN